MAVYINGMDIPQEGRITIQIGADGAVYTVTSCKITAEKYEKESHVIEVPEPHGRLISADELIEFVENRYEITWKYDYDGGIKDACIDVLEKISTMPTVIPASEEKEDTAKRDYEAAADYQQYCEMYEPTYDPETGAM